MGKEIASLNESALEKPSSPVLSTTPRNQEYHAAPEIEARIDNTNRNFKGQQKNEVMHCFTRKHWIVLLPSFIWSILCTALIVGFIIFAASGDFPPSYEIGVLFLIIVMTYFLHRFFLRFFNYYLQTLIITNFRVVLVDQTLYFRRQRDSVDLAEIQDIVINQSGIVKTLLNYGEIVITLSSSSSSKRITCVPNAEYYFRKINKTKREYLTVRQGEQEMGPA